MNITVYNLENIKMYVNKYSYKKSSKRNSYKSGEFLNTTIT